MTTATPVLDFVGNEITAGCTIVYPNRHGSGMWLERMAVTAVEPGKITGFKPNGRRTSVTKLANVVVVNPPKPKIQ